MEPGVKKFWKSLKEDLKNKKALRNATKFVLIFALVFLIFLLVLIPLLAPLWDFFGVVNAHSARAILGSFGIESKVSGNILTTSVNGEDIDFVISQICSGDIEIALLVALLLASFDVVLSWRLIGSIVGAFVFLLINPLRIGLTLLITVKTNLEVGDLAHNVLFRLFLFLLLVFYYFLWYSLTKDRKIPSLKSWRWPSF